MEATAVGGGGDAKQNASVFHPREGMSSALSKSAVDSLT